MNAKTQDAPLQNLLPLSAICHAASADIPVKVVEDLGVGNDGKHYVRFTSDVEGYAEAHALIDQIEPITTRDAALWYAAAFGWAVFPLHAPTGKPNNPCSCNRRRCKSFGQHLCHDKKCDSKGKHSCHWDVCEDVGKHPRTMNGLKAATTDPKKIAEWWTMWPDANVGVVTGAVSGIFAVDIDPAKDGTKTRLQIEQHGKRKLPETKTAKTGGNGLHLVFRHPGGEIKNSVSKIGPGLDIRGDGGYIVAAPSLHASGQKYQWLDGTEMTDAPQWLIDLARKPETAPKSAGPVGDSITDGQRNNTLTSLGGSMRRRGMGVEEIDAALQVTNEQRVKPPLSRSDVRKIAESVSRYAPADEDSFQAPDLDLVPLPEPPEWLNDTPNQEWWDSQPTDAPAPQVAPAEPQKNKSQDDKGDAVPDFGTGFYSSLGELHAKETVPADDLMVGVRRRQVTLFVSVTDVGKTTLMLNHALAAAGGQMWNPLLPNAPARPLKIVFIDAESTDDELKIDTQKMLATVGNAETARTNFIPVVDALIDGEALDLTKPKHFNHVKRFLQYHQPDIAILDTMSSLFTLNDENSNAEIARKVIRPLKALATAANCAVWISHHIGKAGESQVAEEAYLGRGGSAFGGNVRGVINLKKEKDKGPGYVRLTLGKAKGVKFDPVVLKLDFDKRTFTLCAEAPAPKAETPYQQVIGVFNGQPLKTKEIKEKLSKLAGRTIDDVLRTAVKNGDLLRIKDGVYQKTDQNPTENRTSQTSQSLIGSAKSAKSAQTADNNRNNTSQSDPEKNGLCEVFEGELLEPNASNEDLYLDAIDR